MNNCARFTVVFSSILMVLSAFVSLLKLEWALYLMLIAVFFMTASIFLHVNGKEEGERLNE
jgi:cytochrome c biogenesis protein CcdA